MDEHAKLARIAELQQELAKVNDLDLLLEKTLTLARECTGADAGSVYIRDGGRLVFSHTQNETLRRRLPEGKKLVYQTFTIPIDSGSIAGCVAQKGRVLNIPDAYAIPPSAPYHFNPEFDRLADYRTLSLLTAPLITSNRETVGVLQLINATDAGGVRRAFRADDVVLVDAFAGVAALALERAQMTRALILRMIRLAGLRDPKETEGHVNRVGLFAVEIYERWARRRSLSEHEIEHNRDLLRMAAMLHDVGKVGIPDAILKKPGRLDAAEFDVMKQHTVIGAGVFGSSHSALDAAAAEVALCHHENWDGSGYPGRGGEGENTSVRGVVGENIPIFGRIVAVADVYDALCSKRVYKDAMAGDEAVALIKADSGRKFDPEVVAAFLDCVDQLPGLAARYAGS